MRLMTQTPVYGGSGEGGHQERHGRKVTISHMTASHSYDSWYFDKLMSMMVSSKVNVVSNPIVSMHLQGRYDSYPKGGA